MAQYYFDVEVDGKSTRDEEGIPEADIEAAQGEAARLLCELSKTFFKRRLNPSISIQVRDELGPVFRATLTFQFKRVN